MLIEEIQRVALRLNDVARFCKHGLKNGGWYHATFPGLMMLLCVSSLLVVPAPFCLPTGQTNSDIKEISRRLSMRSC